MDTQYDIVTVGGGLGGAALARAMAEHGAKVLVVERETAFRDRVRGEMATPWAVGEAEALGVRGLLLDECAHEASGWDQYINGMAQPRRPLPETTPQGTGVMTFFHPHMQEALIQAAADAGAEVVRGASVREVKPGETPSVTIEHGGATNDVRCRMVAGTDGRNSPLRKSCGFEERDNPRFLQIGGLLFEDVDMDETAMHLWWDIDALRGAYIFPQGQGKARAYVSTRVDDADGRLSGERDVSRFIDMVRSVSRRPDVLRGVHAAGPLATFDGTDSWVVHPYRDGVALLGDAAATSDPSWGQGLGITLRSARELRDQLVADDDWDAAGHRYARNVDDFVRKLLEVEAWFGHLFYDAGPEADERRGRAFGSWEREPERANDLFMSGPDVGDVSEASRKRFFGED